jgi:acyl-CoA reductase-like NAD-dependent aldehyde dehydrogenase
MGMTDTAVRSWQDRAAAVVPEVGAFIDGEHVEPRSQATFSDISPRDGRVIAQVPNSDSADIDDAVGAARRAFDDGRWRDMSPRTRKRRLLAFADAIDAHTDELALLESLDVGKPIGDALRVDVPGCANTIRWYAEAIDKVYDEVAPTGPNALALVRREPVGVVGAVIPWNYPLILAAWKIGPALAAGNTVVLKPAEQSPLSALRLGSLAVEAGLPPGVFNVVPGDGPSAGEPLGRHPQVDAIAFTGSTEVGRRFLAYSAESNLKEVALELGGKSPQVVFADCPDVDATAQAIAWGIFYNAGQTCHAGSRLVVEAAIEEQLLAGIAEVAHTLQPADPLDTRTRMGAIVSAAQHERVRRYLELGQQEAQLRLGGAAVEPVKGGCYVEPTVFTGVDNTMRIARDEIFGPVLTVHRFEGDPDRAITLGNDTDYGLAAAVWTSDINRAHRVARELRAGTVWVNCFDVSDLATPFGGYKASGFGGRDRSLHAFDHVTQLKTTWIGLG